MDRRRYFMWLAPLLVLVLLLAACGSNGGEGQGAAPAPAAEGEAAGEGMIDQLVMGSFGGGTNPQVNYNPFSPNVLIRTYIYEPLMALNSYACEYQPWLATAYEWTDPQNLKFTIREGVKWSDGQPFTADDVAFTFNLMKEHEALDTRGLWKSLESVTAEGNDVLMKFKEPAASLFERVATHWIVPKHIWE